ncbi:MAG: hypothetical protein II399_08090, partial [Lachnospiraceae bacterium]|nr:hypothetical protein [Lachnospiraceae bacterium]
GFAKRIEKSALSEIITAYKKNSSVVKFCSKLDIANGTCGNTQRVDVDYVVAEKEITHHTYCEGDGTFGAYGLSNKCEHCSDEDRYVYYHCLGHTDYCKDATGVQRLYPFGASSRVKVEHIVRISNPDEELDVTDPNHVKLYYYRKSNDALNGRNRICVEVCNGHGTTYHNDSKYQQCENYETKYYWECPGYDEVIDTEEVMKTYSQTVCLGHINCNELHTGKNVHTTCLGHDATILKPNPTVRVDWTLLNGADLADENSLIYKDWEYTRSEGWWIFSKDVTYTPQTLDNGRGWTGWGSAEREHLGTLMAGDWYASYGFSHKLFIGSELSPAERTDILKAFNIDSSNVEVLKIDRINCALDAIGHISLYPGDIPIAGGLDHDGNNIRYTYKGETRYASFGTPAEVVTTDKYALASLAVHGLDGSKFAYWVHMTTKLANSGESEGDVENFERVTDLKPGEYFKDVDTGYTYVSLGTHTLEDGSKNLVFVGFDINGYVSVQVYPFDSSKVRRITYRK